MSKAVVSHHEPPQGNVASYTLGFSLSVALTLVAYLLVTAHHLSRNSLIGVVVGLALVQFIVQAIFFLHVGAESKPRWRLLAFGFMIMTVLILVLGSLWIMNNLNYHMMSPNEEAKYMQEHEGL